VFSVILTKIQEADKIDLDFALYDNSIFTTIRMVYNMLLLTPSFFTKEHNSTYLPNELWDIIFDYKNAMETKDKQTALTKELIVELNDWASPIGSHSNGVNHFTNDIWWWMTEDYEKVVRPEIHQCSECGEYNEDFGGVDYCQNC
tara:strand:+ start:121 stop:555 length:435 start_codon:yes stop_codon:yes gene_type:complete